MVNLESEMVRSPVMASALELTARNNACPVPGRKENSTITGRRLREREFLYSWFEDDIRCGRAEQVTAPTNESVTLRTSGGNFRIGGDSLRTCISPEPSK